MKKKQIESRLSLNKGIIGLMSGTSLDGLDIAFCNFSLSKRKWTYKILSAKTYPFTKQWKDKLSTIEKSTPEELALLHSEFGHFLGKKVKEFMIEFSIPRKRVIVSSHGHTIFHQPPKKFTLQIGNGAAIAAECGLPVVCDFRTLDVALGGQGAPLVPIGDKFLFSEYEYCLNIGGIANISFEKKTINLNQKSSGRIAFDICPANMVLNFLANQAGKNYDNNGEIANSGMVSETLLNELNGLAFYSLKPPKSLGKEWVLKEFLPVLNRYDLSVKDKLRTVVEHISVQITNSLRLNSGGKIGMNNRKKVAMLITGGGAHNKFLIERIRKNSGIHLSLPDKLTIDFKEALIFAFLGELRMRGKNNCLSSVTGAIRDCSGGAVYLP